MKAAMRTVMIFYLAVFMTVCCVQAVYADDGEFYVSDNAQFDETVDTIKLSVGETRPYGSSPGGFLGYVTKNEWKVDDNNIVRVIPGELSSLGCTLKGLKVGTTILRAYIETSQGSHTPTFTVVVTNDPLPSPTPKPTYWISYRANGGSNAPAGQEKKHGVDIYLSTEKPTHADEAGEPYTITLDANEGSVSPTTLSSATTKKYSFVNWQSGGATYNPGELYTYNRDDILVAQWNYKTVATAVTLPTPTRAGYDFEGWAEKRDAIIGAIGEYTPSKDITLYAVWVKDFHAVPISAVTFPDANFRSYVQRFDADGNGYLDYREIITTTEMYCSNKDIASLKGIEYFTQLKTLVCENNRLEALDLSAFPKLTTLNCSNNNLEHLTASGPANVQTVNVTGNSLKTVDIPDYGRLRRLQVSFDGALEVLNLPGSEDVQIGNGDISIPGSSLRYLDLEGNSYVTSITCNGSSLEHMNLHSCTALESVSCGEIRTAMDLSDCTRLTSLSFTSSQPIDLDLHGCTKLGSRLKFDSKQALNSLDVSGCTSLTYLSVNDNHLTLLNARGAGLRSLECQMNYLVTLDVGGQEANLIHLMAAENDLPVLDISDCPQIYPSKFPQRYTFVGYSSRARGGSFTRYAFSLQGNQDSQMFSVDSETQVLYESHLQVTRQPLDVATYEGSIARFSAAASGDNLRYQWYIKEPGANKYKVCTMDGAQTDALLVPASMNLDGIEVYCKMLDSSNRVASTASAKLTVLPKEFLPEPESYTVTYNANEGSGAPANQTKTKGTALTLSSTKPTRASSSAGSYTVTFNANGGSVSPTSLTAARTTSYTFKNWNTEANGSGTSYNPGASYTADSNLNLFAQWNSSTSTASVTLPTPTRNGYDFIGWATSSSATSGVTGSYTPSGNVTLFAAWVTDAKTGTWGNLNWKLDNNGTLTIAGNGAMKNCSYTTDAWLSYADSIVKVEIKPGVTNIGDYTFYQCSSLTSVTIPSSVTSIGNAAFYHCFNLNSMTIPSSVISIGDAAFNGCALSSVTIPSSVTSIGNGAFTGCSYLTGFSVSSANGSYCDLNGVLFDKNRTMIICYPGSRSGSYTIPSSVTSIGDGAFSASLNLTRVTIPSSVTSIGKYAFNLCQDLNYITIPSSVRSIGEYAFRECTVLRNVYFGGVQQQWNAISISSGNEQLTTATLHCIEPDFILPASLVVIKSEAFAGGAFTYVKLPEWCTSIGWHAFAECPNLKYISIPDGCAIDPEAFSGVSGLTILGESGGSVQTWAGEHGYTFIPAA